MKILDIGAGSEFVNPRSLSPLAEEKGGVHEAVIRWMYRDTLLQIQKLFPDAEEFEVHGLDIQRPPDFSCPDRQFTFKGIESGEQSEKYQLITCFYPYFEGILRAITCSKTGERSTLLGCISRNLQRLDLDGRFVIEADNSLVENVQFLVLRQILQTTLIRSSELFGTNDPWNEFACVYKRK